MAVPKSTETRCTDGSVQARHGIQRLQVTPSLHLFLIPFCKLCYDITGKSNL